MNKIYKIIIIGAGPAGVVFYNELLHFYKSKDILIIDKYGTICGNVKKLGLFYENKDAKTPQKYNFLVNGTLKGRDIKLYFEKKYNKTPKVLKFNVFRVSKDKKVFKLTNKNNKNLFTEKLIIATGLKKKKINLKINNKSNVSDKKVSYILKHTDFNNQEIVIIGSGDNAAYRALKLSRFIEFKKHKNYCVKIIARKYFLNYINPIFKKEINYYIKLKIIKIKTLQSNVDHIVYNKISFIKEIIFDDKKSYKSNLKLGALADVQIGYIPNLPKNLDLKDKNITLVGDLDLWYKKEVISLYKSTRNTYLKSKIFTKKLKCYTQKKSK